MILATSRERLIQKLSLLQECCQNTCTGMVINEKNNRIYGYQWNRGRDEDPIFLPLCGCNIKYCWKYTYLGAVFTSDGKISSAIKEHAKDKTRHFNKLQCTMFSQGKSGATIYS